MKKIIVILTTFSIIMSGTELYQFLKIPALVGHYLEHRSMNSTLSLSEFFHIHYSEHMPVDEDAEKDMQLPFKSHLCTHSIDNTYGVPSSSIDLFTQPTTFLRKMYIADEALLPSPFHLDIWQPPRQS